MEKVVVDIIAEHPEYYRLLENDDAIETDFPVDAGTVNPFLHLSMHVAIHEQVATDRPAGIRGLYVQLKKDHGDTHALEHALMECLGQSLWEAQRSSDAAPDERGYLECVRQLIRRR